MVKVTLNEDGSIVDINGILCRKNPNGPPILGIKRVEFDEEAKVLILLVVFTENGDWKYVIGQNRWIKFK